MRVFELHRKQVLDDDTSPLRGFHARIDIEMDFGGANLPATEQRQLVLDTLRTLLNEAVPEDVSGLSTPLHRTAQMPSSPTGAPQSWEKPGEMDMRVIKSAHRVVAEVAKRGMSGRAVLASELVGSIGLSAPTLGRLLRDGEEANQYLSKYVSVSPNGRTKSLDLTVEGRVLASKIRAGVVPA